MAMNQAAKPTGRETTLAQSIEAGCRDAVALLGELHRAYPNTIPARTEVVAATATLRTGFAKAQLADLKQVALAMGVPLFVSRPRS